MLEQKQKVLLQIKEEICKAKSFNEMFDIACRISFVFQDLARGDIAILINDVEIKNALVYEYVWELMTNEAFVSAISKVMTEERKKFLELKNEQSKEKKLFFTQSEINQKSLKELYSKFETERKELEEKCRDLNIEEKKFLQIVLYLSCLPLTFLNNQCDTNELNSFANQFNILIKRILISQEYQFSKTKVIDFLNQVAYDNKYRDNKKFPQELQGKINDKVLFRNLANSRNVLGCTIIVLSQNERLSTAFKKSTRLIKQNDYYRLYDAVKDITRQLHIIESNLQEYKKDYNSRNEDDFLEYYLSIINKDVSVNTQYILKEMLFPLRSKRTGKEEDLIGFMITNSHVIKNRVVTHFRQNFSVFTGQKGIENDWSNKLFLISIRTLSVIEQLAHTKDDKWKYAVFINEYISWLDQVNNVINKHNFEDDWEKLKKYLVQENTTTEWKSTFLTPTQEKFIDDKAEKSLAKETLRNVVKPIIGMLNTDGGIVLVGVVENPTAIVREDIKDNTIKREGYTLFDIDYEFQQKNTDLDSIKRAIQDLLFEITGYTAEKFNNLTSFEALEVKADDKKATIIKITIIKSEKYIYTKSVVNSKTIYSLLKRADGRTLEVDLEPFLIKDNI